MIFTTFSSRKGWWFRRAMAIAMASHVTRSEFKWVEKTCWIEVNCPDFGQLGITYPKKSDWLNRRLDELMCYLMNVSYLLSKRHEHTLGIPYHGYITVVGLNMDEHSNWLVVSTYPSEKIWLRQLGWLFPIYGKMFQTTNQTWMNTAPMLDSIIWN